MGERILYTEDGDEVKVLDEESIQSLQKTQELFESLKNDLSIAEGQDLKDAIKELKESSNPNWAEARGKIKMLENTIKVLESQGKSINENGEIVEKEEKFKKEDIANIASESAMNALIQKELDYSLEEYDAEEQKLIKRNYEKLINGEKVTIANVNIFVKQAIKASDLDKKEISGSRKAFNNIGNKGGANVNKNKNFAETDAGKDILSKMNIKLEDKK